MTVVLRCNGSGVAVHLLYRDALLRFWLWGSARGGDIYVVDCSGGDASFFAQ